MKLRYKLGIGGDFATDGVAEATHISEEELTKWRYKWDDQFFPIDDFHETIDYIRQDFRFSVHAGKIIQALDAYLIITQGVRGIHYEIHKEGNVLLVFVED